MKATLFEGRSFSDFWVLHAVILVSYELLPLSFKYVGNSSLSNSHNGGGCGAVVVVGSGDGTGGGNADESSGGVLLSMPV